MKSFNVPSFYRSPLISKLKLHYKTQDPHRKIKQPFILNTETCAIVIARHFGFCYGVENAIDIAFKALHEHPGKSIYLLSEMIHNPQVNSDLRQRGVQFLNDTQGNPLIPLQTLKSDDVIIIPAFGASLEVLSAINALQLQVHTYDATCPFVERVWNRAEKLATSQHTILIHGTFNHEETRATFSRAVIQNTPVLVIRTPEEAAYLAECIKHNADDGEFKTRFTGRYSPGFEPSRDLTRIGVINQTTMLAPETQHIADIIKSALEIRYGSEALKLHFAETRDTLCYATNENQEAVLELRNVCPDMVFVIGGYNSSNTSHLVEICESVCPTFFIEHADCIQKTQIHHYNLHKKNIENSMWPHLPQYPKIAFTSGASCPDAVFEDVVFKVAQQFNLNANQVTTYFNAL